MRLSHPEPDHTCDGERKEGIKCERVRGGLATPADGECGHERERDSEERIGTEEPADEEPADLVATPGPGNPERNEARERNPPMERPGSDPPPDCRDSTPQHERRSPHGQPLNIFPARVEQKQSEGSEPE